MRASEFVRVRISARVTLGLDKSLPVIRVLGRVLLLLIESIGSIVRSRLISILLILLGFCFLLGLRLFFSLLGRSSLLLILFELTKMAVK